MDKLEAEIAKAKREAADLRRRAEEKELEAKTLMRAAKLRPALAPQEPDASASNAVLVDPDAHSGGRQRGAISKQWRAVLWGMYAKGRNSPHSLEEVELLAESVGLNLQPGSTLARLKNYQKLGYVEEFGGNYIVSKAAIERFDLSRTHEDTD